MHLYIYIVIDVLKANILLYWTIFRWSPPMIVRRKSERGCKQGGWGRARKEWEARREERKRGKTGREMRGRRARCAMQSSLLLFCDALSIFYTNGVHFSWTNFRRTQESVETLDDDRKSSEDRACSSTELDHSSRNQHAHTNTSTLYTYDKHTYRYQHVYKYIYKYKYTRV